MIIIRTVSEIIVVKDQKGTSTKRERYDMCHVQPTHIKHFWGYEINNNVNMKSKVSIGT